LIAAIKTLVEFAIPALAVHVIIAGTPGIAAASRGVFHFAHLPFFSSLSLSLSLFFLSLSMVTSGIVFPGHRI